MARRLRAELPAATLVALSGYSGGEYRARAREAGFDAYLVKPVELDELRAVLGSLAREREGTRSSA